MSAFEQPKEGSSAHKLPGLSRNKGGANHIPLLRWLPLGGDFDLLRPEVDSTLPGDVGRITEFRAQNPTKAEGFTWHRDTNVNPDHASGEFLLIFMATQQATCQPTPESQSASAYVCIFNNSLLGMYQTYKTPKLGGFLRFFANHQL